jgi:putative transposase
MRYSGDYRWSSYSRHALGLGDDGLVDHDCDVALGPDVASRPTAYQALFRQPHALAGLAAIRHQINRSGILGNGRFQEEIARALGRRVQPAKPGRPRQTPDASHAEQIM